MRNLFLIATFLLSFTAFNASAQQAKIAHIDYYSVVDSLPSKIAADREIKKFLKEGQEVVAQMEAQLEIDVQKYMAERETLSVVMQEVREKQLQEQSQIIEIKRQTLQQDLQVLNERLYAPIEENLQKAIDIVAERYGVTYVLDKNQLLYVNGGLDLTDEVRKEMIKMETGG